MSPSASTFANRYIIVFYKMQYLPISLKNYREHIPILCNYIIWEYKIMIYHNFSIEIIFSSKKTAHEGAVWSKNTCAFLSKHVEREEAEGQNTQTNEPLCC